MTELSLRFHVDDVIREVTYTPQSGDYAVIYMMLLLATHEWKLHPRNYSLRVTETRHANSLWNNVYNRILGGYASTHSYTDYWNKLTPSFILQ